MNQQVIEQLIAWFRNTLDSTAFGKVSITVYMRAGQIATTEHDCKQTQRVDGQLESDRQTDSQP